MNTKTHTRRKVDHYLELVKAFPLKPICCIRSGS